MGPVVILQIIQHLGLAQRQPGILQLRQQLPVHHGLIGQKQIVKAVFHRKIPPLSRHFISILIISKLTFVL